MADLLARGAGPNERWRRTVTESQVTVGRSTTRSDWAVPWDPLISGLHATVRWQGGRLLVRRAPTGRNPVFFRGQPHDEFEVAPGESFVIGETSFTVLESGEAEPDAESDGPAPMTDLTYSREELRQVRFLDADERIAVLARLPEVIRHAPSEQDLEDRVLEVLLHGIPRAEAAAVVRLGGQAAGDIQEVQVHSVRVSAGRAAAFRPSRRLANAAIAQRGKSVLNVWSGATGRDDFTAHVSYDWAMCVPLPPEPTPGWGLYVAGRLFNAGLRLDRSMDSEPLKADLKFAELVGDIFGSLRQVRDLQSRQALLARFLSKTVLTAVAKQGVEEVLRPRTADVTVLFGDLRGYSRLSEQNEGDLDGLWQRVGAALSIMTGNIIGTDGVVGDFYGDAAMGFWGWPLPMDDQAERAARAALAIRREFNRAGRDPASPLYGFSCGIGLAGGRAIAGRLGTPDQHKVTLFGPVVNVAARLESLTRQFSPLPILADEPTATRLSRPENRSWVRCRRLARVRPHGMEKVVTLFQVLPEPAEPGTLTAEERKVFETALEHFEAGRWAEARPLLQNLPQGDCGVRFLLEFMARHRDSPPPGWDGVISLGSK